MGASLGIPNSAVRLAKTQDALDYARMAGGEGRPRKRGLAHYRQCLTLLQERLPDSPLVAQLDAELERVLLESRELAPAGLT